MKTNLKSILFILTCSFFFFSCSKGFKGQDVSKGSILNGKDASEFETSSRENKGANPGLVMALTYKGKIFCSGVLLNSNYILTAAHCFDDEDKMPFEENVQVYRGEGIEGGIVGKGLPVKKVAINPLYGEIPLFEGRADLALVQLENPILDFSQSVEIFSDHLEIRKNLKKDNPVLLMGYGRRGKNREDGFGVKHFTQFPILSFTQNEVTTFGGETDACPGDSGGPLFLKGSEGKWKLLGIVSRGTGAHCDGKAVSTSTGEYTGEKASTQFGLVFDSLCWIGEIMGGEMKELGKRFCHKDSLSSTQRSFIHQCQRKESLSSSKKNLMDYLISLTGKEGKSSTCQEIQESLESITEMDLSQKILSDLSPLVGAQGLEKVNLSLNRLRNVKSLLSLPNLKQVKVDHIDLIWKDLVDLKRQKPEINIIFPNSLRDIYLIKSYQIVNEGKIETLEDYLLMGLSPIDLIGPTIDWDKPKLFHFLLKKIEKFDDEYMATQALDFTIIKNDKETFSLLVEKYGVDSALGIDMALMENSYWAFRKMLKYGVDPDFILKSMLNDKNFEMVTWILEKGGSREVALKFAQEKNWKELLSYLNN